MLVRWAGADASADTWEPLENLTHCDDAVRAFEQARGVTLPRPALAPPSQGLGGVPLPAAPPGFEVDAAAPLADDAALVGRRILYWWPDDGGWQLGEVAKFGARAPFSHVVAYKRRTSSLRGTADTLLDRPSYGQRWVLLSPAPSSGLSPSSASRP